jgi:iron complex outermembrane receptor protein
MKAAFVLALLPAVCLCWTVTSIHAQDGAGLEAAGLVSAELDSHRTIPCAKNDPDAPGRIAGVLKDQSGAVVQGVKVEAMHLASGVKRLVTTGTEGRFAFDGVAPGRYQITAIATAFQVAIIHDVLVQPCKETIVNIVLRVAPAMTVVEVTEQAIESDGATRQLDLSDQAQSRSAAELAGDAPGVSLRENGQLASVPLLHGLGDERAKLVVDGMTVSSACANHMNPPLSYVAPSQIAEFRVMAGITPVSMGGDSIGGTIAVESRRPVFASPSERLHEENSSAGFFRSNGQNYGGSMTEWVAGRNLGLGYTGWWTTNENYTDGSGRKVTSTYAQSTDHTVIVAAQGGRNSISVEGGLHHVAYQGFPNAYMDMVRNFSESLNLHYHRSFEGAWLDSHVFWQGAWHSMNIGHDKSTFPMAMWMPMNTHGRDIGYAVRLDAALGARHTFSAGNEFHRFVLDDRWPAVPGAAPMMGPDTFVNINNGRRLRVGTFAEIASKWTSQWTTLFGLRNDTVRTNAGPVQGYSAMMYGADANAFNALIRAKTDVNFDFTGTARYQPASSHAYEFGYARKTRVPNLYERYAWSTNMMASGMIGWFGDGNYYVGNVDLKPETANIVGGTARWRGGTGSPWEIKLTPFMNYIRNYVDVDTLMTQTYGMSTFAQLQFANHNARIYGTDLSASGAIWNNPTFGLARVAAVAGWLHGERLDTSTGLYQMMPINARIAFDEELRGFTAGAGIQAVDRKSKIDPQRFEQVTPGYSLFNIHAVYRRGHFSAGAATENLLNKTYNLPLGGMNVDDFLASMWTSERRPLTGRGRSASLNLTERF